MSRACNLAMTEAEVVKHCHDRGIAISALEALPDGGTRLVCMSNYGAHQIRSRLGQYIIEDNARRELLRPRSPLW